MAKIHNSDKFCGTTESINGHMSVPQHIGKSLF